MMGMMSLMWLFFVLLIVLVIILLVIGWTWLARNRNAAESSEHPLSVLQRRLADGEISREQYRALKEEIEEGR